MSGRLVIAGTHSGVGKTTITAGLIAALRQRGLNVQPFKVGPDFIDPTYHTLAAGRSCRNLDTWMLPSERVRTSFIRSARNADIAVIEGVMGLFDGAGYDGDCGSTAEIAKLVSAPVVLVLDAAKMGRSAAALALGYQQFDKNLDLAGFIINRAASESHGKGVAAAVEDATGLPAFGYLPRDEQLQIPERYLGLIPASEPGRWHDFTAHAARSLARRIDVDRLLALAYRALPLDADESEPEFVASGERITIAVARDEAFSFIYEDNLDLLRAAGAEIVSFSPLRDEALPPRTAGIILCGGFPEVYAEPLSANKRMHAALRAAHQAKLPIYAECGGLMYLTREIRDQNGSPHPMVGILPGRCEMGERLTIGYRLARSANNSWFLQKDEQIRGHEFHYSSWVDLPSDLPPAYLIRSRTAAADVKPEGASFGNLWASYVHVHFGANPEIASRFVEACRQALKKGDGK